MEKISHAMASGQCGGAAAAAVHSRRNSCAEEEENRIGDHSCIYEGCFKLLLQHFLPQLSRVGHALDEAKRQRVRGEEVKLEHRHRFSTCLGHNFILTCGHEDPL